MHITIGFGVSVPTEEWSEEWSLCNVAAFCLKYSDVFIPAASSGNVRFVVLNGVPLYGDDELELLGPSNPGCEAMTIQSTAKFPYVAEASGTASMKLRQTFAQIESALSQALADYDALNLSAWKFMAPFALVK
jgi:hypothetical protein